MYLVASTFFLQRNLLRSSLRSGQFETGLVHANHSDLDNIPTEIKFPYGSTETGGLEFVLSVHMFHSSYLDDLGIPGKWYSLEVFQNGHVCTKGR